MKICSRLRIIAASLAVCVVLAACSDPAADSGARLIAGKKLLESGKLESAVLELKSAVQADGNNHEARFLLGGAYLKIGNAAGALKEFERARELGLATNELKLGLTRALVMTGKFDQAATEISISGDPADPAWRVLQAMLDFSAQRYAEAKTAYQEVLDKDPENVEAHRGLLQTELALGNSTLAREEITRALAVTQDDFAIWMLKGELDASQQQFTDARAAYEKALALMPDNPAAHLGLAMTLLSLEAIPEATKELDALGSAAEDDPRVNYLRALIAQRRKEPEAALRHLAKVLQVTPNHIQSMGLAATLNLELGDYAMAEDYLEAILAIDPEHAEAKRMLSTVQLAAGRLDEALGSAPDLDVEKLENPQMLALLGAAYLRSGRYEEGAKSLEKAHALDPESPLIRTQLALGKLSTGKADEALADLAAIRGQAPDFVQAYLVSVIAYLDRNENPTALQISEEYLARHPQMAVAHNLVGFVQQNLGQLDAARNHYEAALAVDKSFHPAELNIARLDVQAGHQDLAKKRLENMLQQTPHLTDALLGLASLALKNNDADEAERLWQQAREHDPNAGAPRLMLANHYLKTGKMSQAREMASEAYKLAPYSPSALMTYGIVMLASGDTAQAVPVLERLVERAPGHARSLELLAEAYNRAGNEQKVEETLARITAVAPHSVVANIGLARLAAKRGDFPRAYDIAEKLVAVVETASAGYGLKGDILVMDRKLGDAVSAYARAYELTPTSESVVKLYSAEKQAHGNSDRLAVWLEQHPEDTAVRAIYATELQAAGRPDEAIKQYEQVLAREANNAAVLNNLAWLYNEAGREDAVDFARRAYAAAPEHAEVIDTYGWVLVGRGKPEQGLDLLRKAVDQAPQNGDIRYHYAAALSAKGEHGAAVQELQALLEKNQTFALRADAEALLAKLTAKP